MTLMEIEENYYVQQEEFEEDHITLITLYYDKEEICMECKNSLITSS